MLTCKGCIHGCITNNQRCSKYTRKKKNEVQKVQAEVVTEKKAEEPKVMQLELDDGYRCKRQCADHRNYICPMNPFPCMCPGICRGRIAAGHCSGCERFERISEAA